MERINNINSNGHNRHKTAVLEKELVQDIETLEALSQRMMWRSPKKMLQFKKSTKRKRD
ncbi:MAG: hypothetical protein ACREPR_06065 [Brasilonema sp.]